MHLCVRLCVSACVYVCLCLLLCVCPLHVRLEKECGVSGNITLPCSCLHTGEWHTDARRNAKPEVAPVEGGGHWDSRNNTSVDPYLRQHRGDGASWAPQAVKRGKRLLEETGPCREVLEGRLLQSMLRDLQGASTCAKRRAGELGVGDSPL